MAEAIVHLKDTANGIIMEAKFSPGIDDNSPAHQAVAKLAEICGLEKVSDAADVQDKQ